MKSLIIKKIDGFDVVTGFQERPICPVSTQNKNRQAALDLPVSLELRSKNDQQNTYRLQWMEARKLAKGFLYLAGQDKKNGDSDTKNKAESAKQTENAKNLDGAMKTINDEMKVLTLACKDECETILRDNPVYNDEVTYIDADGKKQAAGPRKGEVIKTKAEIDDLTMKLAAQPGSGTALLVDGSFVEDCRGKIYCDKSSGKWVTETIENLDVGLPGSARYKEDLTAAEKTEISEQENIERLAGMSAADKTAEYESKKAGLAGQAQTMETSLKFDGDVDYQQKAQEFYTFELVELKIEYGVK